MSVWLCVNGPPSAPGVLSIEESHLPPYRCRLEQQEVKTEERRSRGALGTPPPPVPLLPGPPGIEQPPSWAAARGPPRSDLGTDPEPH